MRGLFFLLILLSAQLNASVTKVVPHLAINSSWRSLLSLRNDLTVPTAISMEFINSRGELVTCVTYDSDGASYRGSSLQLTLQGYEFYTLEFDQITSGDLNISVFLTSSDNSNYSIEAIYNFYSGTSKLASVGVPYQGANYNFLLNIDHRQDAYSGRKLFRGLAVTNTSNSTCNCRAELFTDGANGENLEGPYQLGNLQIARNGKWLWVSTSGINGFSLDPLMPKKIGYFSLVCDQKVAVLGLAFEENSAVAASVPITFYTVGKNKDGKSVRLPATGF